MTCVTYSLRKLPHAIYRDFFSPVKIENFIRKNLIFFLIFAQNIDCVYTLEPPRRGVYPCIPQFSYIKVGFKGVYITRTCFRDVQNQLVKKVIVGFTSFEPEEDERPKWGRTCL